MQYWSISGISPYGRVADLQKQLVELRAAEAIPDTVLFLEHEPVVTRGRGLQWTGVARERHVEVPTLPASIAFAESERGGDLTYHGPGQLVFYPIVKLDGSGFGPLRDVATLLRKVEQIVLDELGTLGVFAESRQDATGVWVGAHKIASLGIAVRKWVSFHGVALNVVNDLSPFLLFQPCGYRGEVMTRLKDLLPERPEGLQDWSDWRSWLEARLVPRFSNGVLESMTLSDAEKRLEALSGRPCSLESRIVPSGFASGPPPSKFP